MSNIIFALASGLVLGLHYGGRHGAVPSPILHLNILLFLACSIFFLRETNERRQARYHTISLGTDDVVAILYAICLMAAWLVGYAPKITSPLKWVGLLNVIAAIASYLAWVWWRQAGRERERQEWEQKFKEKHQIKA